MLDSPFLYLSACSMKNRVLSRVRRLREPRYLVGAVVGAAYLYLVFFRRMRARGTIVRRGAGRVTIPPEILAGLQLAGAFFLWAIVLMRWIVPVSTLPLQLTGAERDMLLTAPVTRRRITRYKLMRSMLGVFLSTALMLVIAWTSVGSRLSFLLGMFLLLTTLRMHLLGVALNRTAIVRARRADLGALVAIAVVAAGTLGAVACLVPGIVVLQRAQDLEPALLVVRDAASRPFAAAGLLPFSLVVRPVFAEWPGPFFAACWPAVAMALLSYAWVIRSQEVAGDAEAVGEQQAVEGTRAPARAVYRRPPFQLAPDGRPELALVWKNLIMLGRYASPRMLLRVALPVVAFAIVVATGRHERLATAAFPIAAAISGGLTLLGPYSFRNDLRQDLGCLPVLKTWPISGERLLWGEVLAPTAAVSAIVCVCVGLTAILALAAPPMQMRWAMWAGITVAALVLFPVMILAQVVVQNAAVVLFPAWVATGPSRPRGVEAMGQQMLMFAGTALLLVLGLLPGGLIGGGLTFVGFFLIGWLALIPGALVTAALILAEIVLAVHFLGAVLDRTDPTAVEA